MKRLIGRLKREPALIGTALVVAMDLAAAFGLELEPGQRDAILAAVPLIIGLGFGVRHQVKPMAKVREEEAGRIASFRGSRS